MKARRSCWFRQRDAGAEIGGLGSKGNRRAEFAQPDRDSQLYHQHRHGGSATMQISGAANQTIMSALPDCIYRLS
jgi:hypothetical protein